MVSMGVRVAAVRRRILRRWYYVLLADGRPEEAYLDYKEFKRNAKTLERRLKEWHMFLSTGT